MTNPKEQLLWKIVARRIYRADLKAKSTAWGEGRAF
jgi:hypothetical protein